MPSIPRRFMVASRDVPAPTRHDTIALVRRTTITPALQANLRQSCQMQPNEVSAGGNSRGRIRTGDPRLMNPLL